MPETTPAGQTRPTTAESPTIAERLAEANGPLFGFEFFPPKDDAGAAQLRDAIGHLEPLGPDFVSVTYGASGSTRERTIKATREIASTTNLTVMGHLTCASQATADLVRTVEAYGETGLKHVLAIRGDMPGGPTAPWEQHPEGLANATELVRLVKQHGDFCVGVAAFPDVHPEKQDAALDARILVEKAEAGADFAITQLFFNPDAYFDLVERVRDLGCQIPIIPGIMPITNVRQIERFAELSGAPVPEQVVNRLGAVADDPAQVRKVGSRIASEIAVTLLRGGAPGLQFFTQNRSLATREIFAKLAESRW
ncbi:methylenetetrahydrofolate reductase [Luteococcus sanguinis]|uniref:Methylenetetrahydrofolate reductase n=1 Tax=Luteococcus sanguinis TaxID=174038 RepID=A0ABW1X1Q2_9ACTN